MSIGINYKLSRPDNSMATMKIEMSLSEWRQLKEQLSSSYPAWRLSSAIQDLITRAEAHFEAKVEVEP